MGANIIRHPGASNVDAAAGGIEDRFALTFEPAKPVRDAMTKLRKVRNHIAECDRWDPKRNDTFGRLTVQLALIPDIATLQQAKRLFHEAEHVPAPEEWLYLAIGLLLAAAPNSSRVPVDYTYGLVDSIMNDDELHRGYAEMGFSFATVERAIREVRRDCKWVPSAHEVLEACVKHRRGFRQLTVDVELMIMVRENAELPIDPPEDWSDVPF